MRGETGSIFKIVVLDLVGYRVSLGLVDICVPEEK